MSVQAQFGVVFDFMLGCRVIIPAYDGGSIRKVRIYDNALPPMEFMFEKQQRFVTTNKGYFIRYKIEIIDNDRIVYTHDFNPKGRNVLIRIGAALGDTLAWMPYVNRFGEIHGCNLIVGIGKDYIPLFKRTYPHIKFIDGTLLNNEDWVNKNDIYASYILAYSSDNRVCVIRTKDSRTMTLGDVAQHCLGMDEGTIKPKVTIMSPNKRPIKERYAIISAAAGGDFKRWNNPYGWRVVIDHLKARGYRVVCIDKEQPFGPGRYHPYYPDGLEDQTGNRPLTERARWIVHADLFVGLASGLSWLAWAVDTPVVMISGFSDPMTEFHTPYRIINRAVCNSCWNDLSLPQFRGQYPWCPRQLGTDRQYECSIKITPDRVIAVVDTALKEKAPQSEALV